jgi:hypothetical protein
MNSLPAIIGPVASASRANDAAGARTRTSVIDLDPIFGYAPSDDSPQPIKTEIGSRARQQGFGARDQRRRLIEPPPATNPGFAAQHIAQEVLSDGLYFENFRPALAAYAAAGTNFVHVRKPPPSSVVVWA